MPLNRPHLARLIAATGAAAVVLAVLTPTGTASAADAFPPTPGVPCDAGSLPESTQGRVPLAEVTSGRAAKGYTCNSRQLSQFGNTGGYRVESYVDKAGHVCGYYDTTQLFPKDVDRAGVDGTGVYVMDMADPRKPKHVNTLRTPAMQSPHETMRLDKKRGLLIAALSYVAFAPSALEIYDLSADCRAPVLKSATPLGIFGHESGLAPDGKTYYIAGLDGQTLAAVDISNATQPRLIWLTRGFFPHGMSVSDDGNRLYVTERASRVSTSTYRGVTILDVTEVQKRTLNPNVPVISRTTWPNVGTPQFAEPFTSGGRKYLMEIDEFGEDATHIGAGRILDLQDEKKPVVISNLRLKVNQEQAQLGEQKTDPGASVQFQGYRGHNCVLPTRVNPTMVACSFIVSGLRIFDIQDPAKPQEVAYFNGKIRPSSDPSRQGAFALAAPAFSPRKGEIWHADGNLGFHVVQLTANAKRVGPAADKAAVQAKRPAAPSPADGPLPATGLPLALPALGVLSLAVLLGVRRRRTV